MGDLLIEVGDLTEGPQSTIIEHIPNFYSVYIRELTLHIDCHTYLESGGAEDLLYVQLATALGLVNRVLFHTIHTSYYYPRGGQQIAQVRLISFEEFWPFLGLLSGVPFSFHNDLQPVLESWRSGTPFVEALQSIFGEPRFDIFISWRPIPGYNPLDYQSVSPQSKEDGWDIDLSDPLGRHGTKFIKYILYM